MGRGVVSIQWAAFYACTNLTRVEIPDSVASIGSDAFYYCSSLANVSVGSGITNISTDAFAFCPSLKELYFAGNAPDISPYAFWNDYGVVIYCLPGTTGWGLTLNNVPIRVWDAEMDLTGPGPGVRKDRFGFNIMGSGDFTVIVEACTNLANPIWLPGTNTLSGGSAHFSDSAWTNSPTRFYRLRAP